MAQPTIPSLTNLGQRLSQAREALGFSVPALAHKLNMGIEQLTALESGDLDRLPEAVFVIAQARRVAQSLGLCIDDEVDALRQTAAFTAKRIRVEELKSQPQQPENSPAPPQAPTGKPTRGAALGAGPAISSLVLVAGLAAGGTALWQHRQGQQQLLQQQTLAQEVLLKTARLAQAAQISHAKVLVLTSAAGSWLDVKTFAGKQLFRGAFKGRQTFPLNDGLKVLAGRPDLVLEQVGAAPARPLGTIKQIKWKSYGPSQAARPGPSTALTPPKPRHLAP